MKSLRKRWIAILLCLIAVTAILPVNAFAAGAIDTNKDVSLTINYKHNNKGVEGAKFSLYKIAAVDDRGRYTLTGDFESYPVSMEIMDQRGWELLAETLAGYAQRDRLACVDSGTTDKDGLLRFPTGTKTLKPGLYLVVGETLASGGYVYTTKAFIVALPMITDSNTWNYNLTTQPKYERTEDHAVSRKVLKVWDDKGFETARPSEVIVQLLKNGTVYETVTLNQRNRWRYEWTDLDNRYTWTVVEKEVNGYTTRVELKSGTFTVTNTYVVPEASEEIPVTKKLTGDKPSQQTSFTFVLKARDSGYPMPEGSVNGTKEISVTGAGTVSFGKITFEKAGIYEYTVSEKNTGAANYSFDASTYTVRYTVTEKEGKLEVEQSIKKSDGSHPASIIFTNSYKTPGNKLPQTGLLWWPVSVLTITGLTMILIGLIRRKYAKDEK